MNDEKSSVNDSAKNVAKDNADSAKNVAKDNADSAKNVEKENVDSAKIVEKDIVDSVKGVAKDNTDSAKNEEKEKKEVDTKTMIKEILETEKSKCAYVKFIALCIGIMTVFAIIIVL